MELNFINFDWYIFVLLLESLIVDDDTLSIKYIPSPPSVSEKSDDAMEVSVTDWPSSSMVVVDIFSGL